MINNIKNNIKKYKFYVFILIFIIVCFILNLNIKELFNNNDYILPKIIWIYWDKDVLPKHIELIFNNNKTILGNEWTFNLIHESNLNTFIDISNIPKNYNLLQIQHKADYVRLKVLEKYGGIYMDASILINLKDKIYELYNDTINNKYEITLFTLYDKDESFIYHQYIENWFIIAPQKSKIIILWLEEYEKAINMGFEEYKKYIKDELKIKLCGNIESSNCYLTQHTALQVVLQNRINWKPNIKLLRSEETMFKLLTECNFNNDCVKTNIENKDNKDIKNIPYIKLTGAGNNIEMEKYFS